MEAAGDGAVLGREFGGADEQQIPHRQNAPVRNDKAICISQG